jgi:superfamily I DNA/RNA helicase
VAIGKTIEQMVGGTGFHAIDFGKVAEVSNESGFADFAVLCRTTEQVRLIGDVLQQAGIPCRQVSRQVLRQAPGTAKLLSLLRVMAGQACYVDLNPLIDLIAPGISRKTLDIFKAWAYAAGMSLAQALRAAVRIPIPGMSTARQKRLAALVHLVHSLKNDCAGRTVPDIVAGCIARTTLAHHLQSDTVQTLLATADQGADLPAFLAAQALQRDTDLHRPDVEKVALMTLHASKGLEFPVVFIAGCEQGVIPFHRPGAEGLDPDEERRLFFVALTRAKERLYLSWARRRMRFGTTADQRLSPFVEDIERRLKQVVCAQPANAVQQQLSLF